MDLAASNHPHETGGHKMQRAVIELKPGVAWVGVKDWTRRTFDSLVPLPRGTSYNAYVVRGSERTALVDTVNPGFEEQLLDRLAAVTDPTQLDYVVMNHAEPDHGSALEKVLATSPGAKLVLTAKGAEMASRYYGVERDRMSIVKEGDSLDLGDKTLRFVDAPFLHWPETMFTYVVEDRILLPCDFFGLHSAAGVYDDELPEAVELAKAYFGEIMMPFRKPGQRAMQKLDGLAIDLIGPSHGPVWRQPERILEPYRRWTAGETARKAVAAYVSMWGSTEHLVEYAVEALLDHGVQLRVYDLATADVGELAADLVDARAVVFGSPTLINGLHPAAAHGAALLSILRPPARHAILLSSYGWSGGALRQAEELLRPTGIEIVGSHEVHGRPGPEDQARVASLVAELVAKMDGEAATS